MGRVNFRRWRRNPLRRGTDVEEAWAGWVAAGPTIPAERVRRRSVPHGVDDALHGTCEP